MPMLAVFMRDHGRSVRRPFPAPGLALGRVARLRRRPATSDDVLMVGAYGRAVIKPVRKLYCNTTIPLTAAIAALVIGGAEGLRLIGRKLGLEDSSWRLERVSLNRKHSVMRGPKRGGCVN